MFHARRLWFVASLALASTLTAQTSDRLGVALTTADAVGVRANRQIDGARAGVTIDRPLSLSAVATRSAAAHSVAGRDVFLRDIAPGVGARFAWRGHAGDGEVAGTLGGAPLTDGAQHYRLVLSHPAGVQGRIVVAFGGDARGGASARASVATAAGAHRFVADGQPHRAVIPAAVVGPRGLVVDVSIAGQAAGTPRIGAAYSAELRVAFVPDPVAPTCTVTPGTRSCPEGGLLAGRIADTRGGPVLGMQLTGALPSAIGVTVVSPDAATFPIQGLPGCVFLQTPIVHSVFQTDAQGDARNFLSFPARPGGQFSVQQATLAVSPRGVRLATSNTLDVACN